MQIKPLYTIAEVARMLQVSRAVVYRMIDKGDLDVTEVRGRRFITLSGLQGKVALWESIRMAQSWKGDD